MHKSVIIELGIAYILPLAFCFVVYGVVWTTGVGLLKVQDLWKYAVLAIVGLPISCLSALGEEIRWRGFLLTELGKIFSVRKVHLIIGITWFLYHAPLMLFSNYNNGNKIYSMICFFCMVIGMTIISNELCLKAKSFLPAVILHASHNLFVQSIFDKMTECKHYTQLVTSEFGIGLAFMYLMTALVYCWQKKKGCCKNEMFN